MTGRSRPPCALPSGGRAASRKPPPPPPALARRRAPRGAGREWPPRPLALKSCVRCAWPTLSKFMEAAVHVEGASARPLIVGCRLRGAGAVIGVSFIGSGGGRVVQCDVQAYGKAGIFAFGGFAIEVVDCKCESMTRLLDRKTHV